MSWEAFKAAYPRRAGAYAWAIAKDRAVALVASKKATWEQLVDGAKRYDAFLRATGKWGTEYVQMPTTFLGRAAGWEEDWELPADALGPVVLTDEQKRELTVAREAAKEGLIRDPSETLDAFAERVRKAYLNRIMRRPA
jgi:hypothetical protein